MTDYTESVPLSVAQAYMAAAADKARRQVLSGLQAAAELNGSGPAILKAIHDAAGHDHGEDDGRFVGKEGESGPKAGKPSGPVPHAAHIDAANSALAAYHDAKKALKAAHAMLKSEAAKALSAVDEANGAVSVAVNGIHYAEGKHEEHFLAIDQLQSEYNPEWSSADKASFFREVGQAANKLLRENRKLKPGAELSEAEIAGNVPHIQWVLDAAKGAAAALKVHKELLTAAKEIRGGVVRKAIRKATGWSESQHPRDKHGQFLDKGAVDRAAGEAAAGNHAAADKLRSEVRPEDLGLLNEHLAHPSPVHPSARTGDVRRQRSVGDEKADDVTSWLKAVTHVVRHTGSYDHHEINLAIHRAANGTTPMLRRVLRVLDPETKVSQQPATKAGLQKRIREIMEAAVHAAQGEHKTQQAFAEKERLAKEQEHDAAHALRVHDARERLHRFESWHRAEPHDPQAASAVQAAREYAARLLGHEDAGALAKAFKEEEHPRDHGKFAEKNTDQPAAHTHTFTHHGAKIEARFNSDESERIEHQGRWRVLTTLRNGVKSVQVIDTEGKHDSHAVYFRGRSDEEMEKNREQEVQDAATERDQQANEAMEAEYKKRQADREGRQAEFEAKVGHEVLHPQQVIGILRAAGLESFKRSRPKSGVAGQSGVDVDKVPGKKTWLRVEYNSQYTDDDVNHAEKAWEMRSALESAGYHVESSKGDPLILFVRKPSAVLKSRDVTGHEHRGKGPGGGQFTSGNSGGGKGKGDSKQDSKTPKPSTAARPKRTKEEAPKSDKAARAKQAAVRVDSDIQRYAEEHSEPRFAKAIGGVSFPNGEPVDVVAPGKDGKVAHGVELKTMVVGKDDKLTMNSYAQVRKIEWEKAQGATFHTVVLDDRAVKDAKGKGQHDESKRVYYYRRGVAGSARLGSLHRVDSLDQLQELMAMPEEKLPDAAKRTDGHLRVGRWKFFQDAEGKGYKNSKTAQVFRAKK